MIADTAFNRACENVWVALVAIFAAVFLERTSHE